MVARNDVPGSRRAAAFGAITIIGLAASSILGYHLRSTVGSLPRFATDAAAGVSTATGCPASHLVTGNDVSEIYTVQYPCGWHIFAYSEEDQEREGIVRQVVAIDRFPFNLDLFPIEGPLGADVEIWDYFAPPGDERDALTHPLREWTDLLQEKIGTVEGKEVVQAVGGVKMTHLTGENPVHVASEGYIIEFSAEQGGRRRHVVIIFGQTSDPVVRDALTHVAGSFRLPRGTSA